MSILGSKHQKGDMLYIIEPYGLKFPKMAKFHSYDEFEEDMRVYMLRDRSYKWIEFDNVEQCVFTSPVLAHGEILSRCMGFIEETQLTLDCIDATEKAVLRQEGALKEKYPHASDWGKPYEVGDMVLTSYQWSSSKHLYAPEKWLETVQLHIVTHVHKSVIETHEVGGSPLNTKSWSKQERDGRFHKDVDWMLRCVCDYMECHRMEVQEKMNTLKSIKDRLEGRIAESLAKGVAG